MPSHVAVASGLKRPPVPGDRAFDGSLLDDVPAAIIATGPERTITEWSQQAELLYGWARDEALGHPLEELLAPEGTPHVLTEILDRVCLGETWTGELQLRRKDGSPVLCHLTDAPIRGPEGSVVGTIGVSMDITERVRAARRVAARTAVTRALSEPGSVEDMMARLVRTVCQTLGWEVGAVWRVRPGAGVLRCVDAWAAPGLDAARFVRLTRELAMKPGEGLPGRVWRDRTATWVPEVGEVLVFDRGEAGAEIGLRAGFGFPIMLGDQILGVMEFFTRRLEPLADSLVETMSVIGSQVGQFLERKQAERAAIRSEASREAIVEAAIDCVISMDHRGYVVEFNPAAESTFGYDRDEVMGKPLWSLIIPPRLREQHRAGLDRYLRTGESPILGKRLELEGMRSNGSVLPIELTVIRVPGSDPPLFTGYLRDVTERKRSEEALRTSRDQLEAIFQSVAEGITVQGPDGEVVYANEAAAATLGFDSVAELLATPVARIMERFVVLDESGEPLPLSELPGRRALQGEAASRVLRFRTVPAGEERWTEVKATPVRGEDGRPVFAINIFHDITDRQRAQNRQRFLAEASTVLASSLDYEETLSHISKLAVPDLADWCVVTVREPGGALRQMAVQHVDPAKVEWAKDLTRRYPPNPDGSSGVPEVLRTGRAELHPEITEAMLEAAAVDERHLEIMRSLGLESAMIVPMMARSRPIGAITFVTAGSGRRYGPEELRIAEDIAQRAALAVDNARLFRERSLVADALQRSLLPPQLPEIPRAEVAARYYAAGTGNEVGGDFYDVFPTGDGGWALVIGDVCGKGPEAAAVTGLARHTIRAAATQERRPSRILETLNEAVAQQALDHLFCTVCYVRVRVNPNAIRATICCAGHPLPILLRADGDVEVKGSPGTLLGIFPDPELVDRAVDLAPGDTLVLYTDGVVEEQIEGTVFGNDRLISLLRGCAGKIASETAEAIERAVVGFRPEPPRDDIAIVVLRARPDPAPQTANRT